MSVNKLRVLLVADSVSKFSSGGLVVNRIIDVLLSAGAKVAVFSESELGYNTASRSDVHITFGAFSGLGHLFPGNQVKEFQKTIEEFKPDIIHWCSLDYMKSRHLIKVAKTTNARLVAQPWVYNFFCAQGYNYLNGGTCNKCLPNKFYNAIIHNCGESNSKLMQAASRLLYRSDILGFDRFLSTGSVMDDTLINYGANKSLIIRCALPFDKDRLDYLIPHINENRKSFTFYGQFKEFKGAYQLRNIIQTLPEVNFDIYSLHEQDQDINLQQQKISDFCNASLLYKYTWSSGLDVNLANSLGVVLPSLWPTSTEYVLLESMTLRKPIIAYDVGANKDILQNRENAMVVEPNNLEAFCDAVIEVNNNESLRKLLGSNARYTIEKTYNSLSTISALQRAYLD
jgi:glycosyltransferase involved in cell wall biosynthesis